ncbi:MAG TPA: pyridoxal-phosphate dependent enzyme [Acidimicrobiia bacterium]|nr:pyridoxal-phosphate dependent enzyme [Acidimicrobiia bacterium]
MRTVRVPDASAITRALEVVRQHLAVTPVVPAPALGADVWLKLETLQPTGSFKVRGALVAVGAAVEREPDRPIVTASAGNHGLGVAFAASRLGAQATIVVPEKASPAKLAALERFPITLVRHGDSYDDAERHALALADAGALFVSPYNDPDVIAGQGTIALELRAQIPALATIVTPIGGGGLASGLGLATHGTSTRVIAAEASQSPAFRSALDAGHPVTVAVGATLADGLAGNLEPGSVTFDLVRRDITDVVTVSEDEIADAMRLLVREHGVVVEGSAAVAAAAVATGRVPLADGPVAIVLTGRNVATATLARVLG